MSDRAPIRLPANRDRAIDLAPLNRRDPRGSTQRQAWQSSGDMPMVYEWDAATALRYGYLANVIAFRCVQLRANAVASIPIVAGRRMGDAKTINENAPITRLLGPPPGGPAPRLSASKLIRWTIAQEIVTGRRAWEIESDDNDVPIAFWPLVAAQLDAVASKGGVEWFTEFRYGSRHDPVKFKPKDVFFGWDPSGTDFRQAESVFQSARYDLSLVTMSDRYGLSFLKNNAVPAAVVTTTAFPDEAMKRAFERQWGAEFQGPDAAGRTMFNYVGGDGDGPVAESIDIKVLGLSAKDSRLIEQRKAAMAEIAIALGTPWSKLDASGRTFDNAEIEDRTWYEETILPDLTDLQDDINMQLAPRLGSDVCWFDLRGVRALQRKMVPMSQPVGAPSMVQSRIWKIDEARVDTGQEPLPNGEGDRFLTDDEVILFLAPASAAAADSVVTPGLDPAKTPPALPPAPNLPAPDGTLTATREADPEVVEQRRAKVWRTADATAKGLEQRWERALRKLFERQAKAVLDRLAGKRGRRTVEQRDPSAQIDPSSIFDLAFWVQETSDVVDGLYEDVTAAGLARLSLAYSIHFDLSAPFVRQFIEQRTNQLAGPITQTTYDAIQSALVDGVEAGESIDDIATRVRSVFTQASETRAVTIARTEVIGAYNGAASLGASQLPADVVAGQEWIATRDGRTREAHASADGQIIPIGASFDVGGHQLAYPGDPAGGASNVVNCRCTVGFLTPEEFADETSRLPRQIERRTAIALLALVDEHTDFVKWRRAAEEVAA